MANPNEFSQPASYLNGGPFETTWGPYATKEAACLALKNEVDADGKNRRMGKKVAIGTVTDYVEHAWIGGFEDINIKPVSTSPDEIRDIRDITFPVNKDPKLFLINPSDNYIPIELTVINSIQNVIVLNPLPGLKYKIGRFSTISTGAEKWIIQIRNADSNAVVAQSTQVPTNPAGVSTIIFPQTVEGTIFMITVDYSVLPSETLLLNYSSGKIIFSRNTYQYQDFSSLKNNPFIGFTPGSFASKSDAKISDSTTVFAIQSDNAGNLNQYKVWRENQLSFAGFGAEFSPLNSFEISTIGVYAAHISSFAQISVNIVVRVYKGVVITNNVPSFTSATLLASSSLTPAQYYAQVSTGVDAAALEAAYKQKTVDFPLDNTLTTVVNEKIYVFFTIDSPIPYGVNPTGDTGARIGMYATSPKGSSNVQNVSAIWYQNGVGWQSLIQSGLPIIFKANTNLKLFVEGNSSSNRIDLFPKQRLNTEWFNRYPNLLSFEKYGLFLEKYLNTRPTDRPLIFVMIGDSIIGHDWHTSAGKLLPYDSPPAMTTACISRLVWENLMGERPIMCRYDKPGIFTETSAFTASNADANWNDTGFRSCWTKYSTATNAAISFVIQANFNVGSFIYRTEVAGCSSVIISIAEGNGKLQVKANINDAWSEANGFVFSQAVSAGSQQSQKRLYFQKVSGVTTPINVSVSKNISDGSRLLYWGIEKAVKWGYNVVINSGRGSQTFAGLRNHLTNEVVNYNPSLVIQELSILNELNSNNPTTIRNNMHDFIWGDRAGFTNTWNLRTISSNWTSFQLLAILPGNSKAHFEPTTGDWANIPIANCKAYEAYNACKCLLKQKGDVSFMDWSTAIMREIMSDPAFSNNYDAYYNSGITGNSYTNDGIHQNDKGTNIMAKNLVPIFDVNT